MLLKEFSARWRRRLAGGLLALAIPVSFACLAPLVGCQAEYGSSTMPSGKYMHDDVQYFSGGPDYPFANARIASQKARMQAMGIEPASSMAAGQGASTSSGPTVVR